MSLVGTACPAPAPGWGRFKRSRRCWGLAIAVSLVVVFHSPALIAPREAPLPDFGPDSGAPAKTAVRVPAQESALGVLRARLPGIRVDFEPRTGAPRHVLAGTGFLTGPKGAGNAVAGPGLAGLSEGDPERGAKAFLREHRGLFGFGPEALAQARVKREHTMPHSGLRTVVWEQQVDGRPVFGAVFLSHTTKAGELVSVSSQFVPEPGAAATRGTPQRAVWQAAPPLRAREAVVLAARNLGDGAPGEALNAEELAPGTAAGDVAEQRQVFRGAGLKGRAEASLAWLPTAADRLRLCWDVLLTSRSRGQMYRVLVDAETGEVRLRRCLTEYLSNATYHVFTGDSPTPFAPGATGPVGGVQPPLAAREWVTLGALDTNASPAGWIGEGDNETRGNNVDAHGDADDDNLPDRPRPQGVPWRVFDYPLRTAAPLDLLSQPPATYTSAAVVQLFYWCNWMHDRLYQLGFDEAAGNFQVDNFGRGGAGGDAVEADAQDGSGFNNANMSVPPDGAAPRLQMFLFTGPFPWRDGDLDAQVVLHEYTHGLSERLVGGGVGISAWQTAGMGEGWSDFYGLALLSRPGDDVDGCYAEGGYASYQLGAGFNDNYYYGIRRYPYTTDRAKNPLTFKDIDPSQADGHAGVPRSPLIPNTPDEVHNLGEVWCVTLWEARANVIRKLGWAEGNERILRLVTEGMVLSPPNPTFVEARDAIFLADQVESGGALRQELWAAFAKRGLGYRAVAPSASGTIGVVESFEVADELELLGTGDLAWGGPVGGPFMPGAWSYDLTNTGAAVLEWTLTADSPWLAVTPNSGTLPPGGPATRVLVGLAPLASELPAGFYAGVLHLTNVTHGVGQDRSCTLAVGMPDYFTELFEATPGELAYQTFTFTPDASADGYRVCREPAGALPTDPAGGIGFNLPDDGAAQIELSGTNSVAVYGYRTRLLFVGSNGYVTLGAEDDGNIPSFAAHFAQPRVAALFTDLNPVQAGTVAWQELEDRVVVSYLGVPEFGNNSRSNTFQIELFFDGRLRISYLAVAVSRALAGLSAGEGIPAGFIPSDFNSYGECLPVLSLSAPGHVAENDGVQAGAGSVRLPFVLSTNLEVTLAASDAAVVEVGATVMIPAGQSEATFDLATRDDTRLTGPRQVGLLASAPGFKPGRAALAVWDDETAAVEVRLPATVPKSQRVVTGQVCLSVAPDADVLVGLVSSDPAVLRVPASVFVFAGQTSAVFTASVVLDPYRAGDRAVRVSAQIEGWSGSNAALTVLDPGAVELELTFFNSVVEGSGWLPNAGQVRLPGILASNVEVRLVSGEPHRAQPLASLTIPAGQWAATFGLKLPEDAVVNGDELVPIVATAPGFNPASNAVQVIDNDVVPTILIAPGDQTALAGGTVRFGVEVFGAGPLAYQWQFNGSDLAGATASLLVLTNVTAGEAGSYRVALTNRLGATFSTEAHLSVVPAAAGDILVFSDGTEVGISPFAEALVALGWPYRFYGSGAEKEFMRVLADSEPTNTLVVVDSTLYDHDFSGLVSFVDRGGRAVLQYWDLAADESVAAAFGVAVERDWPAPPPVWHWTGPLFAGVPNPLPLEPVFPDVNGSALRPLEGAVPLAGFTSNAAPSQAAVVLANAGRTLVDGFVLAGIEERPAAVALAENHLLLAAGVWPGTNPPVVLAGPANAVVRAGTNAGLTVLAGGSLPLTYQWRKDGVDLTDGARVTGARSSALRWTAIAEADAGTYGVVVSNRFGTVQATAELRVRMMDGVAWGPVDGPLIVGAPFATTLEARTVADQVAEDFSGFLHLSGVAPGPADRMLLGAIGAPEAGSGDFTVGQAFTPRTNLLVTHVRRYFGSKVALWTEDGTLLAAQPVAGPAGAWSETALATPLLLEAGKRYRLSVYSDAGSYYWREDLAGAFPDGQIEQSYYVTGDEFPNSPTTVRWWFVDLRYAVATPVALAPPAAGPFQHGRWSGALTVSTRATNVLLVAEDGLGARGIAGPFQVVDAPALRVGLSGDGLTLSWPADSSRYLLETSASLAPADWTVVPYSPVPVGGRFVVPLAPGAPSGFYRLRLGP